MEISLSLSLSGAGKFSHARSTTTKLSPFRSSNNLKTLRFNLISTKFTTLVSSSSSSNGKDFEDALTQNMTEEDTDEMFDNLFEKYGKVVFSRNDTKSQTDEVDDDAESLSFAVAIAKEASNVKAADIKVLFVKPLVYWTRFFIITTAFSRPQIEAIRSRIKDLAEEQYSRFSTGDTKPNSWTLLDFGDVIVHIFLPEQRAYYNLEEFYANATSVELPFESEPPFRR